MGKSSPVKRFIAKWTNKEQSGISVHFTGSIGIIYFYNYTAARILYHQSDKSGYLSGVAGYDWT